MTGLFSALGKAASFTARGATITFGSTIVSCYAACKIEEGANRAIYHFAPHKFANVEYANGLTQDQLDAVRIYRRAEETVTTTTPTEEELDTLATPLTLSNEILRRHETEHDEIMMQETRPPLVLEADAQQEEKKTSNNKRHTTSEEQTSSFWKEGEEKLASLVPVALSGQDILACSMTG